MLLFQLSAKDSGQQGHAQCAVAEAYQKQIKVWFFRNICFHSVVYTACETESKRVTLLDILPSLKHA